MGGREVFTVRVLYGFLDPLLKGAENMLREVQRQMFRAIPVDLIE
ncbi:hypothetical protein [Streptomyces sp. NPDC001508]